ncbi:heterokaryon incompatibility protein-domain-containing protein [Aspergillus egyptiacus]|nr:heterokaryon incompatibility protein-domain-containing protein [Aspergillus egyptiacus]
MPGGKRFRNRLGRIFKSDLGSNPPAPAGSHSGVRSQSQVPGQVQEQATGSRRDGNKPTDKANGDSAPSEQSEITTDRKFWLPFDFTEEPEIRGIGSIHYDFVSGIQGEWGRGRTFPPDFVGPPMFQPHDVPDNEYCLPKRLYNVVERRLYQAAELPQGVRYAAISHVWGPNVASIDGFKYGVPWAIPITNESKLEWIFEAVRVVLGERYIWMDVLCLDQGDRAARETEIGDMGKYYRYATGCFVMLDNAYRDCAWGEILSPLEEINGLFKQDQYGMPQTGGADVFGRGAALTTDDMGEHDSLPWIQRIRKIEKASWFQRVWTLQEAVLSKNLLLCTPERHMTTFATLLMTVSISENMMGSLFSVGAESQGFSLLLELQQSETYKILKLRQLHLKGHIGFWTLAQAVRSRACTLENDRVLGVLGMLQRSQPVVNSQLDIHSLWYELWKQALIDGDLSACFYLGERPSPIAGSTMCPDPEAGMGFTCMSDAISSPPPKEAHTVRLTTDGLEIQNVAMALVKTTSPLLCTAQYGPLGEWAKPLLDFADWDEQMQEAVATAMGLPSHRMTLTRDTGTARIEIVPGAWAVYSALNPDYIDPILQALGEGFTEQVRHLAGRVAAQEIRIGNLLRGLGEQDYALVLLVMDNSEPQLAVVTEPVDTPVVAITPHSYRDAPGPGCLICKMSPDGKLRKIGIGLGRTVRPDFYTTSYTIYPPLRS